MGASAVIWAPGERVLIRIQKKLRILGPVENVLVRGYVLSHQRISSDLVSFGQGFYDCALQMPGSKEWEPATIREEDVHPFLFAVRAA